MFTNVVASSRPSVIALCMHHTSFRAHADPSLRNKGCVQDMKNRELRWNFPRVHIPSGSQAICRPDRPAQQQGDQIRAFIPVSAFCHECPHPAAGDAPRNSPRQLYKAFLVPGRPLSLHKGRAASKATHGQIRLHAHRHIFRCMLLMKQKCSH